MVFGVAVSLDFMSFDKIGEEELPVAGNRYRPSSGGCRWPKREIVDGDDMWFQEDGATCNIVDATLDLLKENRIILARGIVNWTPQSRDLTTLVFSLGLQSSVYRRRNATNVGESDKEVVDRNVWASN